MSDNSQGTYVDLQAIGDTISNAIQQAAAGESTGGLAEWFELSLEVLEFRGFPEPAGPLAGMISSFLALTTETTSDSDGTPSFSDDVRVSADRLAFEFHEKTRAVTIQMAQLSDIVVSDYGKLSVAGPNADGPWSWDAKTVPTMLELGARKWAWTRMLGETFGIWGFEPEPGKRINDLYCTPVGSESQNWRPFANQGDAATHGAIAFRPDATPYESTWWTMGTGAGSSDGPDTFLDPKNHHLPGADMMSNVFSKPNPDDPSLQSAGLIRPVFFERAPFIFRERIGKPPTETCSY
ncbi:MAG: hypothetical protein ICV69_15275 [Thermoleophilaceae bacterium]|nr:hypothetical protein [Thermoleophilaceae bacterium]